MSDHTLKMSLRSHKGQPPRAATPPSGETTSGDTNTWDKGTNSTLGDGPSVEPRLQPPPARAPAPAYSEISEDDAEKTLVKSPPGTLCKPNTSAGEKDRFSQCGDRGNKKVRENRSVYSEKCDEKLALLLAELEVHKAALAVANKETETAKLRLQIAQHEAQSVSGKSEPLVEKDEQRVRNWVERQSQLDQSNYVTKNEASALHTIRNNFATSAPAPSAPAPREPHMSTHRPPRDVSSQYAPIMHRPPELPAFDGNITEWIAFRAEFDDTAPMFSYVNNVSRIRRALKGEARTAVKSIMYTVQDPYEIMEALERQFGDPEEIVLTELHNVKRMPRLAEDNSNIVSFAAHVANAVATIKSLKQEKYLYAPELVNKIVDKLNLIVRYEWGKFKQANLNSPDLVAISEFLLEISSAAKRTSRHRGPKPKNAVNTVSFELDNRSGRHTAPARTPAPVFSRDYSSDSNDSYRSPRPQSRVDRAHTGEYRSPTVAQTKPREAKRPAYTGTKPKQHSVPARFTSRDKCLICHNHEHKVEACTKFLNASVTERWDWAKNEKLCYKCLGAAHRGRFKCRYVACGVQQCEAGHHRLLHGLNASKAPVEDKKVSNVHAIRIAPTFLKMMPVEVTGPLGTTQALALLDEGAALSLISHETADRIMPRERGETLDIEGIGGSVSDPDSCNVRFAIRGFCSRHLEMMEALTINRLNVGAQGVSKNIVAQCDHLADIADELCYDSAAPSVIIGQDNWHLIVTRQIISGKSHLPVASLTRLGWSLHGPHRSSEATVAFVGHMGPRTADDEALALMKEHFDIESLGVVKKLPRADPDQRAIDLLEATCEKIPGEDRYRAGLLWRTDNEELPNNKAHALRRLYSLENKLDRDPILKIEYTKHINNLLDKGYAEKVDSPPPQDAPRAWYLAHFATFHPQRGKMRVVWDAAATAYGRSLNSALLAGPDLLESLFGVLVRFREGRTAVIADIKEMFLQIEIIERDRDSLRFVWRGEDRSAAPQEYRMKRLIFGSAASPTTALYVKNKNAYEHAKEFPIAAEKTIKNTYMDDLVVAFDQCESDVRRIVNEIYALNLRASFELRGFASNNPNVISDVVPSKEDTSLIGGGESERTLGLKWNHKRDTLGFNVNLRNTPEDVLNGTKLPTKRQVTSSAMSIFDPIGYVSPISVLGKALMQEVWRTGIGWDTVIPTSLAPAWNSFVSNIQQLRELEIPRYVPARNREADMHVFCDASEKIYAAAIYLVSEGPDGQKSAALVAAKARVAPLRIVSIPRLELQGCVLATRLADTVVKESDYVIKRRYFWSDARTALSWIRSDPRRYKSFVAHRVAEIENTTKPTDWRWVPSALNVADDATKGVPAQFGANHRWFIGPDFIRQAEEHWPREKTVEPVVETCEERVIKPVCSVNTVQNKFAYLPEICRFSKFTRLVRTTARVLVAAEVFKARLSVNRNPETEMNNRHISLAEILLIKRSQNESYAEEIRLLEAGRALPKKSALHRVAMKLDKNGIIVLDARIDRDEAHIPVLHAKEAFTKLLIHHFHALFNHGNHATVINELKQRYYIVGLRGTIRYLTNKCQWCRTYKGATLKVPVGDLPPERLKANQPPFTAAAVDLFGPMQITIGRRREKRWGVLYTCLTTRAVHLELAASLSAASMILSLRRMISRRGAPTVLYSDNATNFYGAERELSEAKNSLPDSLKLFMTERRMIWKKIPPGNPSAGGAWERLVGSVKTALKVTLKDRAPHEEVLHTLLLEAEHLVNSRPLTPVNPDLEAEALTPNHFLIGRSNAMSPLGVFSDENMSLSSWKTAQALADNFWKRWLKEYRPNLMPRSSTHQNATKLHVGDVVIIADGTMPRGTWPRGVIAQLFPGPDGHIRVAIVRTRAGEVRRPVSRLILICSAPIDCADARGGELSQIA